MANNTYAYVFDKYKVRQSPELLENYDLNLPLARIANEFISKTIGMKLVLIPAGEFLMGASEGELASEVRADPVQRAYDFRPERPQHQVRITKPFYMGRFEVTQATR